MRRRDRGVNIRGGSKRGRSFPPVRERLAHARQYSDKVLAVQQQALAFVVKPCMMECMLEREWRKLDRELREMTSTAPGDEV